MGTVTKADKQKSLFSSYLEALESREKQIEAERNLQDEHYLRRTRRIYEFHERQCQEVCELRHCLQYVGEHMQVLEGVLHGDVSGGSGVPLASALVRQASALQSSMQQCVGNATTIRDMLAARHHAHMDTLLAKMERELRGWSSFLERASQALHGSGALLDNVHNMIAVQRRCLSEVSSCGVFASICSAECTPASPSADREEDTNERCRPRLCSTPIAKD